MSTITYNLYINHEDKVFYGCLADVEIDLTADECEIKSVEYKTSHLDKKALEQEGYKPVNYTKFKASLDK